MANITRIKAGDPKKDKPEKIEKIDTSVEPQVVKPAKAPKQKPAKTPKVKKERKGIAKILFIIAAPLRWIAWPFRKLGAYVVASWGEIRQVRWPDRKLTWKLTFTVIMYAVVFGALISALDVLFSWLFNLIIT